MEGSRGPASVSSKVSLRRHQLPSHGTHHEQGPKPNVACRPTSPLPRPTWWPQEEKAGPWEGPLQTPAHLGTSWRNALEGLPRSNAIGAQKDQTEGGPLLLG